MLKKPLECVKTILFVALALLIAGCKESPEFVLVPVDQSLVLSFHLMNGEQEIFIDQPFQDNQGYEIELLTLKFFLSHIKLMNSSGSENEISAVQFFNFEPIDTNVLSPQWGTAAKLFVKEGDYQSLKFGLGLSPIQNSSDPTALEKNNPLSVYSNMYWTWATQYRFIILEAKVDTLSSENFDHNILFHTGLDSLYVAEKEFDIVLSATNFERDTFHFDIEWQLLFDGIYKIDYLKENITHTTDSEEDLELAWRFTQNFANAITMRSN